MTNLTFQHIWMSLFLTSGGTAGGWALTGKLAGHEAALSFLQVGSMAVLVIFSIQVIFFSLGKTRLIYRVVSTIAFGCGFVWFMLCLFLPILWIPSIGFTEKFVLFLLLVVLSIVNVSKASAQFDARWRQEGEKALVRYYNRKDNTIDWPKVLAPMRFSVALYIPGFSERTTPFVSIAIILSMLSGLSLRNAFPIFSVYAWGVPSCLVISMFAQVIGLGLAQLIKLVALEKRFGELIRPRS
jgi:hypothetical protein